MFGALDYIDTIGAATATLALCVTIFVLFEKLSGVTGRWAARQVAVGVEPLKDDVERNNRAIVEHQEWSIAQMAVDHKCIEDRLGVMADYQQYHLGPNGTATPVHKRIADLETQMVVMNQLEEERMRFNKFIDSVNTDVQREEE